jgi:hypothetical protein
MKILHLSDAATMLKHGQNFKSCHYLNLPNGKVISIGEIADVHEVAFIADGAIALPHMLSNESVGEDVAATLSHFGLKSDHKTFEAMMILKTVHPAFSPSQF